MRLPFPPPTPTHRWRHLQWHSHCWLPLPLRGSRRSSLEAGVGSRCPRPLMQLPSPPRQTGPL
eukprot:5699508-Pyramimonas_sp.AAC.1